MIRKHFVNGIISLLTKRRKITLVTLLHRTIKTFLNSLISWQISGFSGKELLKFRLIIIGIIKILIIANHMPIISRSYRIVIAIIRTIIIVKRSGHTPAKRSQTIEFQLLIRFRRNHCHRFCLNIE
ncbi:Uncharacterised protein [Bacteroides xylanisolvens]|nr:Uncharacterised protein [Bacteroides xylanisolvens]